MVLKMGKWLAGLVLGAGCALAQTTVPDTPARAASLMSGQSRNPKVLLGDVAILCELSHQRSNRA
jgi:hypothetical protein